MSESLALSNSYTLSNSLTLTQIEIEDPPSETFAQIVDDDSEAPTYTITITVSRVFSRIETITETFYIRNSYLSNSLVLSLLNSSFTLTNAKVVFYEYTIVRFTLYQSFYTNFFFLAFQARFDVSNGGRGFSVGAIAGIAAAVVVVVGVVVAIVVCFGRKQKVDEEEESVGEYN